LSPGAAALLVVHADGDAAVFGHGDRLVGVGEPALAFGSVAGAALILTADLAKFKKIKFHENQTLSTDYSLNFTEYCSEILIPTMFQAENKHLKLIKRDAQTYLSEPSFIQAGPLIICCK